MKEKKRKKLAKKAAMEVCWGISIAASYGFTHKEMIEFIWKDVMDWADNVDWPEERKQELNNANFLAGS